MNLKVYRFLDSGLDEAEYFDLSKEDLISLKDYLAILKNKDEEFKNSIKEYEDIIKEKCEWVRNILFSGVQLDVSSPLFMSTIKLEGEDNSLDTYYNERNNKYITFPRSLPKFVCFTKKTKDYRNMINSLNNIQDELRTIDEVGKEIFNGYLSNKSASGKFNVDYLPFEGMVLNSHFKALAFYGDEKPYYLEGEFLTNQYQEKALNKILIKK